MNGFIPQELVWQMKAASYQSDMSFSSLRDTLVLGELIVKNCQDFFSPLYSGDAYDLWRSKLPTNEPVSLWQSLEAKHG